MKLLYDFFPIIIFFIAFKLAGIYVATASAIAISLIQVVMYRFKYGRFEKMQLTTLIMIVILGGATLLFHKEIFIKWKVSVINWLFAAACLASQWFSKKNVVQRLLEEKISLSEKIWYRLNMFWVVYFFILGLLNLYVIYHFSTNTWVNFKLFGILGLTFGFVILQAIYLAKHVKDEQ